MNEMKRRFGKKQDPHLLSKTLRSHMTMVLFNFSSENSSERASSDKTGDLDLDSSYILEFT